MNIEPFTNFGPSGGPELDPTTSADTYAMAKKNGWKVPATDELSIDLDDVSTQADVRALVNHLFPGETSITSITRSKSGKGFHVILRTGFVFTQAEKLLVQACLGSDLRRELRSLERRSASRA